MSPPAENDRTVVDLAFDDIFQPFFKRWSRQWKDDEKTERIRKKTWGDQKHRANEDQNAVKQFLRRKLHSFHGHLRPP